MWDMKDMMNAVIMLQTIKDDSTVDLQSTVASVVRDRSAIEDLAEFVAGVDRSLDKAGDVKMYAYVNFCGNGNRNAVPAVEIDLTNVSSLVDVIYDLAAAVNIEPKTLIPLRGNSISFDDRDFKRNLSYWLASTNPDTMELIDHLRIDDDGADNYWLTVTI